jgi:hypothetical protein
MRFFLHAALAVAAYERQNAHIRQRGTDSRQHEAAEEKRRHQIAAETHKRLPALLGQNILERLRDGGVRNGSAEQAIAKPTLGGVNEKDGEMVRN